MKNCEQQEWIDRYLFGELEGEERRRFEAKYATEEAFRTEVDLQAQIMVSINSYSATHPEVVPMRFGSKLLRMKHRVRVAATVALVIMAGMMFQPNDTHTQVADARTISLNDEDYEKPGLFREKVTKYFFNYPCMFDKRS